MTTNITALVQRLKVAAKNGCCHTLFPDDCLALVEALEKAQAQSSKWLEAYHKAVSIGARYEEHIAELESRTVKLPPAVAVADWMVDIDVYEADLVRALLTAAGIKVEAE